MKNDLIPACRNSGELLSHHFNRLLKFRGSFGSWRPRLFELSPRWQWYSRFLFEKKIPAEAYPQINFSDDHDQKARKLIAACLKFNDVGFDDFLKFLLHKFGCAEYEKLPVAVKPYHTAHWENVFKLEQVLTLERDVFGDAYSENVGKGLRDRTGFFPTPMSLSNLLADMCLQGCKLTNSVHDPAVGSGRLLLSASNKSLFLSGIDINPVCIRMTLVNGFLFGPQIVMPPPISFSSTKQRKDFYDLRSIANFQSVLEI